MRQSAPEQAIHLSWKAREDTMQAETTLVGDSVIVAEVICGPEQNGLSMSRNPEDDDSGDSSPVSASYGPLDEVDAWTRRLQEALDDYDRHDLKINNEMEEQVASPASNRRYPMLTRIWCAVTRQNSLHWSIERVSISCIYRIRRKWPPAQGMLPP
eukprot:1332195-Rhodomonas_salina.3